MAGLAADEAAVLVMESYPLTRPFLEKLTRQVEDPLRPLQKLTG